MREQIDDTAADRQVQQDVGVAEAQVRIHEHHSLAGAHAQSDREVHGDSGFALAALGAEQRHAPGEAWRGGGHDGRSGRATGEQRLPLQRPLAHRANRVSHLRGIGDRLEQVALRPGHHRALHVLGALLRADHDHRAVGVLGSDQPGGVDAVDIRQMHIHEDHIGVQLARAAHRLLAGGDDVDDLHVGLGSEHVADQPRGQRAVVYDQDANLRRCHARRSPRPTRSGYGVMTTAGGNYLARWAPAPAFALPVRALDSMPRPTATGCARVVTCRQYTRPPIRGPLAAPGAARQRSRAGSGSGWSWRYGSPRRSATSARASSAPRYAAWSSRETSPAARIARYSSAAVRPTKRWPVGPLRAVAWATTICPSATATRKLPSGSGSQLAPADGWASGTASSGGGVHPAGTSTGVPVAVGGGKARIAAATRAGSVQPRRSTALTWRRKRSTAAGGRRSSVPGTVPSAARPCATRATRARPLPV